MLSDNISKFFIFKYIFLNKYFIALESLFFFLIDMSIAGIFILLSISYKDLPNYTCSKLAKFVFLSFMYIIIGFLNILLIHSGYYNVVFQNYTYNDICLFFIYQLLFYGTLITVYITYLTHLRNECVIIQKNNNSYGIFKVNGDFFVQNVLEIIIFFCLLSIAYYIYKDKKHFIWFFITFIIPIVIMFLSHIYRYGYKNTKQMVIKWFKDLHYNTLQTPIFICCFVLGIILSILFRYYGCNYIVLWTNKIIFFLSIIERIKCFSNKRLLVLSHGSAFWIGLIIGTLTILN